MVLKLSTLHKKPCLFHFKLTKNRVTNQDVMILYKSIQLQCVSLLNVSFLMFQIHEKGILLIVAFTRIFLDFYQWASEIYNPSRTRVHA